MRVDTGSGPAPIGDFDPVTRARRQVAALRRRWYLVIVLALLGVGLGWFSAPEAVSVNKLGVPVATTSYYRASHILLGQSPTSPTPSDTPVQPVDLSRAAYLVNTGQVPEMVAQQLGLPEPQVEQSLLGLPRTQVSSVEVQAIGTDQDQVVKLADSAAADLLTVLQAQNKAAAAANRDELQAKVDKLDAQVSGLTTKIGNDPPDRAQLEAQRSTLASQYSTAFDAVAQLDNQPPPTSGLTSLKGARAVKLSKSDFDELSKTIRDGADYVTGAPATIPTDTGSGSSTPSLGASRTTRAVLGGLVGLAAGIALVLLLDRYDSRLRRRDDVEAATGLTVIAEVPPLARSQQKSREVMAHTHHRSRAAEAYRVVRGALLFADVSQGEASKASADTIGSNGNGNGRASGPGAGGRDGAIVVMVTSANPAEGKTTTVANLAAVLAEGGFSVLVVNCDFRRPLIHRYLLHDGVDREAGSSTSSRQDSVVSNTEIDGVRLVTGIGEDDPNANPLDVVATQRKVVEAARSRFDVILLDTAPFLTTNDASELLVVTDYVVLVVRAGKTRTDSAHRTAEILERLEAPVLGVVLNDSEEGIGAQYYYYNDKSQRHRRSRGLDAEPDEAVELASQP